MASSIVTSLARNVMAAAGLAAAVLALATVPGTAAPVLRNATMRMGFSPAMPAETCAYLYFTVENPDPVAADAVVQLEPEGAGGPVYSKRIRIGPAAALSDRLPVTTSYTENYQVWVFHKGVRTGSPAAGKIMVRLEQSQRPALFLLNDDPEFSGYSDVAKNPGITLHPIFVTMKADQVPETWAGYGQAAAIIIGRPALDQLTDLQIQAIRDFVRRGGTLVWVDPETVLRATATPLRDLIPAIPAGIRRLEDPGEFRKAFAAPGNAKAKTAGAAPQLIPYLEILRPETGRVSASCQGLPAAVWKRESLGTVGLVCFDPFKLGQQENTLAAPVWNHLLANLAGFPPVTGRDGTAELGRLQQLLTGFRIPGVGFVQKLLAAYLAVVALILVVAFKFKAHAWGWIGAGLASIGLTVLIFFQAGRLAVGQPPHNLMAVTVRSWDGAFLAGETTVSLFSKSDGRPSLDADSPQTFFHPQSSGRRTLAPGAAKAASRWNEPPLRVTAGVEGDAHLENLQVQALRPRSFCMAVPAADLAGNAAAAGTHLPVLSFGAAGPRLGNWPLPADLAHSQHAFLVFPGGLHRLDLRGGMVQDTERKESLVQADTLLEAARTWMEQLRLPTPCLALIQAGATAGTPDVAVSPDRYAGYEYGITLVPVRQEFQTGSVQLPPETVAIDPTADARSRMLFREGRWQDNVLRGDKEAYLIQAVLPPGFHHLNVSELRVRTDMTNPGGNLVLDLRMLPAESRSATGASFSSKDLAGGWKAARRDGADWVFTPPPGAAAVNPLTGRINLVLETRQIRALANPLDSERVNRWRILSFTVAVTGARPASELGKY